MPTDLALAIDAKGNALAVWERPDQAAYGESGTLVAAYRKAGSDGWQAPQALGPTGTYWAPAVAFDGAGDATALWISHTADWTSQVLLSSTRDATTGRWSPPVQLSPDGEWAVGPPQLGVDAAGNAVAVWGYREVAYRPASGSWQAPTTPFALSTWQLATAADGSMLLVGIDGQTSNIEAYSVYRGSWSGPTTVDRSTQCALPVAAIAPGGNAVISWTTSEHGNDIVYSAARIGGAWQPPTPLSFVDGNADSPAVGIDGRGDMLAIWNATVDPESSFRSATSATWQRPVVVAPSVPYTTPTLAMNAAGQAVAAWTGGTYDGKTDLPVGAAYFDTDAGWKPAQTIGTQGTQNVSRSPAVAIDAWGDAVTLWQHYERTDAGFVLASIQTAVLDNGGPLLHAAFNRVRPHISGHARVGRTVNCAPGKWSGKTPIAFTFGWLRDSRTVGKSRNFLVRRADVGHSLVCRVRATNAFGPVDATSRPVRVTH